MNQQAFPDFDTLMQMAKNHPEKLDDLLKDEVEQVISTASKKHHHRLRGLQFQVDAQRVLAKNPMDACVRISQMMHKSFGKLHMTLNEFSEQDAQTNPVIKTLSGKQQDVSDIVYFEQKKRSPEAT